MSLKTAQLELNFEKSLALAQQLIADDSLRRLRVDQVLLEADNDELRRELEVASDNATAALQGEASLRERLDDAFNEITRLQNALHAECQELERLKVSTAYLSPHGIRVDGLNRSILLVHQTILHTNRKDWKKKISV